MWVFAAMAKLKDVPNLLATHVPNSNIPYLLSFFFLPRNHFPISGAFKPRIFPKWGKRGSGVLELHRDIGAVRRIDLP